MERTVRTNPMYHWSLIFMAAGRKLKNLPAAHFYSLPNYP